MNVLFLVVDSLRQDFCFSDTTTTPTVDTLRDRGVTFNQAISGASWTPPSMSSIFSGIYPHRLGMYDFSATYPDGVQNLFELLAEEGYEVGSFVFDENLLFQEVPSANVVDNFRDYSKPKQWIADHADDDFFLFVHHYWVHGPYEPQDSAEEWSNANAEIRRRLRNEPDVAIEECKELYKNAIERMSEEWLSGLLETLKNLDISDDTIVVFTGDHGEGWGSRYPDPDVIETNFHMHGKLLYDEHIHVPLIIDYPKSKAKGKTIKEQVRHVDLFPTVTDLLGIKANGNWKRDGQTLTPAIQNKNINSRTAISSATDTDFETIEKIAVREPKKKLIWNIPTDTVELYDLSTDPNESKDLSDDRREEVSELYECAKQAYANVPEESREIDEVARDRLRDLGYL